MFFLSDFGSDNPAVNECDKNNENKSLPNFSVQKKKGNLIQNSKTYTKFKAANFVNYSLGPWYSFVYKKFAKVPQKNISQLFLSPSGNALCLQLSFCVLSQLPTPLLNSRSSSKLSRFLESETSASL